MPTGVQCFDQSGNMLVDITSRLMRFAGSVNLTDSSNGSVVVPVAGAVWCSFQPNGIWGTTTTMDTLRPNFSVSGATVSWSYPAPATKQPFVVTGTLFYGVY